MRNRLLSRYIPKNSDPIEHPEGLAVVYVYNSERSGKPVAIAYTGKAQRPAWHFNFRTVAERTEKINGYFDSLEAHKKQVKARRTDSKKDFAAIGKEYYSVSETAHFARKALHSVFPQVAFSVRSSSYAGGASITVEWTDGPSEADVKTITELFVAGGFDGMIDMKYSCWAWMTPDGTVYAGGTRGTEGSRGTVSAHQEEKPHPDAKRVNFGADSIHLHRKPSLQQYRAAAEFVAQNMGLAALNYEETETGLVRCVSDAAGTIVPFDFRVIDGEPHITEALHSNRYDTVVDRAARCYDFLTKQVLSA